MDLGNAYRFDDDLSTLIVRNGAVSWQGLGWTEDSRKPSRFASCFAKYMDGHALLPAAEHSGGAKRGSISAAITCAQLVLPQS